MLSEMPPASETAARLAFALIESSSVPLVLLDGNLTVIAASASFCRAFQIDPGSVQGSNVFELGQGEWDAPQLRSLLNGTIWGSVRIDQYEMDLKAKDRAPRHLILNAQKLDYGDAAEVRLLLTVSDVTQARIQEKLKDDLLREKTILLQEAQHRVANSLQIIASVLMLSARQVQSDETRGYLHDAHHRVMSIATVQKQLARSTSSTVELRLYFTQLCESLGASMIRDHAQLTLSVHADESAVDADTSTCLGLIVTELVINALKHAFPNDRVGKISVGYQARGTQWTLSVNDDGVGMPSNHENVEPGLGTSIVAALAQKLHATVHAANDHPGTSVSIVHA